MSFRAFYVDINVNTFIYQVNFNFPSIIFVPDDFCDVFRVAGGAFRRPCNCTLTIALH